MFEIQKNYKDCMENSEEIQIPGDGHKAADGIWYYYVPRLKQDLTNKLRAHLELTNYIITQLLWKELGLFCMNLY